MRSLNFSEKILIKQTNNLLYQWFTNRSDAVSISRYRQMLEEDDITGLAYFSLTCLIMSMMGDYVNADEELQEDGRKAFQKMQGTYKAHLEESVSFLPYGFFASVPIYKLDQSTQKAYLESLRSLEHERVTFKGTSQYIEKIEYRDLDSIRDLKYKPGFIFHLINESNLRAGNTPYGNPLARRAYKAWEAFKVIDASYLVVCQKQATKLLIGKTDTEATINIGTEEAPLEVQQAQLFLDALEQAENSSTMVINATDEVAAIDQTSKGEIFSQAFNILERRRFRSFLHPQTIFGGNESGVGDAGLSENQHQLIMMLISAKAEYIASQFVEQVIRPMHDFNHTSVKDYGKITVNKEDPKALEIAKLIIEGLKTDNFDDYKENALDRLFDIVGISK